MAHATGLLHSPLVRIAILFVVVLLFASRSTAALAAMSWSC